jgi:hypothetical protein
MTARSLLCLLAVSVALLAQLIGAIEGQITDPSGAAVPAASVQTVSRDTVICNAQSDNQGRSRVSRLSRSILFRFCGSRLDSAESIPDQFHRARLSPGDLRRQLYGPLSKKANFFVDADRRITDENSIANRQPTKNQ